ncbi:MAG: aldo/keto reductase [Proteobacteria bacterium]|nr:aldo/keto reductase [Pseudomonadota bacterium]
MATGSEPQLNRRGFLISAGMAAGAPMGASLPAQAADHPPIGRRRLGTLEVSAIGIGVQNMSRTYQTTIPTRSEMWSIIRTAFDRGVTFFDAAEAYGPHEVERILGEGIAPFRDKVVITSKFGWNIDLETGARRPGLNSRPDHIKQAVEGMLKRLRTDRIDLLYQHRVDPERHPQGGEPILPENLPQNLSLVQLLKKWALQKQATPAQIALAWLLAQRSWIVPIPGTTQMPHMLENIGAATVRFSAAELAELNRQVSAIQIHGARLPEAVQVYSGVEAAPRRG